MSLAQDIKFKSPELGFDLVGITDASPIDAEQVNLFANWLKAGYAGQMSYLYKNLEKRINPAKLLKNAQSVICVGLSYKPPLSLRVHRAKQSHHTHPAERTGKVATYALYEDYHTFIKKKLRTLIDFVTSAAGRNHSGSGSLPATASAFAEMSRRDEKFKICVDSAPLAERALAARAGLGFIGKNHMLINPTLGPQLFLGEIITTLKLNPDKPVLCHSESASADEESPSRTANCSNCNKCIAACPTGALRPDGRFDANKCINYLTIEYKGQIPTDLAEKIGNHLFGCDECILACPYQQNGIVCKNKEFKFYADRAKLNLQEILDLTEEQFEAKFVDSVIKRLGLQGLKRNAQICLDNIISQNRLN